MRAILFLLILSISPAFAGPAQVPFGDRVDQSVRNYHRATPDIATSGALGEGGLGLLKELGFKSILDLRTAAEGTDQEAAEAATLGLAYHNIPIGSAPPTAEQLDRFAQLVEAGDSYPLLIHCASGNRVGAVWAVYRMARGVPLEEALLEGRTIGMQPAREPQVMEYAAAMER
jgi:uncharacterized protein (TIGR01244 family)